MHSYINPALVKNFSKKKTMESVLDDVLNKYKITNILDDEDGEASWYICKALYDDYEIGRANYEAYIEEGMNARMLMELRKSAVFFVSEDGNKYFYTGLGVCETWQEVREFRKKYFQQYNEDYQELDWQYYYLVKTVCGKFSKDFYFDYEACFADGDWRKETKVEDYELGWFNAHVPESLRREY